MHFKWMHAGIFRCIMSLFIFSVLFPFYSNQFSVGVWKVCGEGRRVLFLNWVKTQFQMQIWSEHHWTAHDCNTVYSEALWFALLLPWPPPLPHTMHHLFFPFSASIARLSSVFLFPPISARHLWFTTHSMSIAFLFLSSGIVCAEALAVPSFGRVWWILRDASWWLKRPR